MSAGTVPASGAPARRGPRRRGRARDAAVPYVLVGPAVAVLLAVLGYPLVRLLWLSVTEFGLPQQFGAPAPFVGLDNYAGLLGDGYFWVVLGRTLVFVAAAVTATIGLGLAVGLLMRALGGAGRAAVGTSLVLAWAMPPLSSTIVWQWLFDSRHGLVNWLVTASGVADLRGHSWLAQPLSFFGVALVVVVWMSVPFVALTIFAALTQVPGEVLEAGQLDGAGPWQRFRHLTLPFLRPVLAVLVALSVVWDFRVFTQIYVLQQAGGTTAETNLLGVYVYRISIGENRFDVGAAAAVVMVVLVLALTVVYLDRTTRLEDS
ncbi:MAG: carbohydrate ABC transporter permease [Kineosporiaceae bacterium]